LRRKHIAILITFGPEVRAFIHSGLARKLAQRWEVTIFAIAPDSKALETVEDINIFPLPNAKERGSLRRFRYWATQVHQEWLGAQGRQRWRHYIVHNVPQKRGTIKQLALSRMRSRTLSALFLQFERTFARAFGTHPEWKSVFETNEIDCILTSSFGSARILPALQTASNLGITSVILINSWKDVYTHPYMAVIPVRIAVWTEQIAVDLYSANPHLPKDRLKVYPSLHLEKFLTPDSIMPKEQFYTEMGLDPERPYLCYTAASPKAVKNEEIIVEYLLKAIDAGQLSGDPQLLLRLNPMEDGSRFSHLPARYSDLIIQKPDWEWSEKRDWCCALQKDIDYWVTTVFYSQLNISIPSTVTLEFLTLDRPIINICFDAVEGLPPEKSNTRFWEADFYSEMRTHPLVQPAFSYDELVAKTQQTLEKYPGSSQENTLPRVKDISPVERTYRMIEELLAR